MPKLTRRHARFDALSDNQIAATRIKLHRRSACDAEHPTFSRASARNSERAERSAGQTLKRGQGFALMPINIWIAIGALLYRSWTHSGIVDDATASSFRVTP